MVREEIDEKPVNVEKAFRQHHYEWATDGDADGFLMHQTYRKAPMPY
ncbi:hypothetical protein SC09_Contig24orf00860 [Bacillus subtilis]|uniref:Uncharacterized protein n=1 Tax=Bacillus subtilis TaxID=1423 RepID=A0A0D1L017_BACIU|nr:hypothetical protein SC09_Contig24orf00860 [Bacillus subtilis]